MVDAVKERLEMSLEADVLHQLLHGYAQGHRLLHGSIKVPDELLRLFLRMTDLSGNDITRGFEEYITGYPVPPLRAYALGKTWYASEMPRPGCVWTHTLLIPTPVMRQISSLAALCSLFKRPGGFDQASFYGKPLPLSDVLHVTGMEEPPRTETAIPLSTLFFMYYGKDAKALLLPSKSSREFESELLALWSQQWPSLRMQFTFCTGSLSNRTYNQSPLDVQCVPLSLTREVARESGTTKESRSEIVTVVSESTPLWAVTAAADALSSSGGELRRFLWSIADTRAGRGEFASLVTVFDAVAGAESLPDMIDAIATAFPAATDGESAKSVLLASRADGLVDHRYSEPEILLELAKTRHAGSFDGVSLGLRARGARLCTGDPASAKSLIAELFATTLNPLGEEILGGLISTVDAEMVQDIVRQRPELLPSLFRQNALLATSKELWAMGVDRRRELLDSVSSQSQLDHSTVYAIVSAILESNGQGLVRLVLEKWGTYAVEPILDWTDSHSGEMSELFRQALTFHVPAVMDWIESHPKASHKSLVSIAHIVAPYSYQIAKRDSQIWRRTFELIPDAGNEREKNYICTLLLALGLGNAPPAPLDLLADSFERIHDIAERDRLTDDAWVIMSPLVPELSWFSNWDKCERLRRALVLAFIKNRWPSSMLMRVVSNTGLRRQVLRSARKIDGGEEYFDNAYLSG